jgi:hypothetical protein
MPNVILRIQKQKKFTTDDAETTYQQSPMPLMILNGAFFCSGLTIRVFLGDCCLCDRVLTMTRVQRSVTVSATCITPAYEQWRAESDYYQWRAA